MARGVPAGGMVVLYCGGCGSPVSRENASCRTCRSELADAYRCSRCDGSVDRDSDICGSCGAAFTTFYDHECPRCGRAVEQEAKRCPYCDATFFRPLRRRVVRRGDMKKKGGTSGKRSTE